jgi:hypothetical protein
LEIIGEYKKLEYYMGTVQEIKTCPTTKYELLIKEIRALPNGVVQEPHGIIDNNRLSST